jgi:hypothetical protein
MQVQCIMTYEQYLWRVALASKTVKLEHRVDKQAKFNDEEICSC